MADSQRAVLIKVRDTGKLAAAKGGAAGGLFAQLLPQTIDSKVYGDIRDKVSMALKEEGVDADVKVVSPDGYVLAGSSPIWKPVAIGLGATAVGIGLWKILGHFRKR